MYSILNPNVVYQDTSPDVTEHDIDVVSDLWDIDGREVYRGARDPRYTHANVYWLYNEDLERVGCAEHNKKDQADFRVLWFRESEFGTLLQEDWTIGDLRLNGCRAFIHIGLNGIVMRIQIIKDFILKCPFEKVELSNRRIQLSKLNTLPSAEWVKHLFAVRLEMALVCEVDNHMLPVFREIGNVMLLCIIGDEPIDKTQTHS